MRWMKTLQPNVPIQRSMPTVFVSRESLDIKLLLRYLPQYKPHIIMSF